MTRCDAETLQGRRCTRESYKKGLCKIHYRMSLEDSCSEESLSEEEVVEYISSPRRAVQASGRVSPHADILMTGHTMAPYAPNNPAPPFIVTPGKAPGEVTVMVSPKRKITQGYKNRAVFSGAYELHCAGFGFGGPRV